MRSWSVNFFQIFLLSCGFRIGNFSIVCSTIVVWIIHLSLSFTDCAAADVVSSFFTVGCLCFSTFPPFFLECRSMKSSLKKGKKSFLPFRLSRTTTHFCLFPKVRLASQTSGDAPVYLNVYDLTPINGYMYWAGLGIFHTGVEGTICWYCWKSFYGFTHLEMGCFVKMLMMKFLRLSNGLFICLNIHEFPLMWIHDICLWTSHSTHCTLPSDKLQHMLVNFNWLRYCWLCLIIFVAIPWIL